MMENKLMTVIMTTLAGALANAISFGTYGYFKEKGYGYWTAGALAGGLVAGGSALVLAAFKNTATEEQAMAGCLSGGCAGLGGVTMTRIPKALGYLTAQQLNGVTIQQLSGVTIEPLGAIPRSAQRRNRIPYKAPTTHLRRFRVA